jgi:hypothetical protein
MSLIFSCSKQRTDNDVEHLQQHTIRLKETVKEYEREIGRYEEKERQILNKNKSLVNKLKCEKDEVSISLGNLICTHLLVQANLGLESHSSSSFRSSGFGRVTSCFVVSSSNHCSRKSIRHPQVGTSRPCLLPPILAHAKF